MPGMTSLAPQRLFWKRKRWIAAAVLWLVVVSYPVVSGPAAYCVGRGWIAGQTFNAVYAPVREVATRTGTNVRWMNWISAWAFRGLKDREAASL
jgi:hypothetical protein